MFVKAVFKSTFGFSCVLFVTVVTLYHVDLTNRMWFSVMYSGQNIVDSRGAAE